MQEALANIHRHATASQARVDGRLISGQLHFVIRDDGCGFQDAERVSGGRGIPGMRARSQRWGGRLHIRPGPQGTKVHVILPAAPGL
jgi:signal transduction histidine kinase